METTGTSNRWWKFNTSQGVLLLAIAILLFSFMLRVPNPDSAVIGVLERMTLDLEFKFLRRYYPRPAMLEPVLIGIDEAAEEVFEEPLALWHRHFAKTLDALLVAKPALIGMDIQMPPRSFDKFVPGLDYTFLVSLFKVKQTVPFVVVHTVDRVGNLAPVNPTYLNRLGDDSFALDRVLEDKDRVARRYNEAEFVLEGSLKPFAGHISRLLGREPGAGYIDFSIGEPISYVPMQNVVQWLNMGNVAELQRQFAGRLVLIGSVTKGQDRWNLPVAISTWETNPTGELQINQPGVVIHYQSLRSMLSGGLIKPIPEYLKWLICALILCIVFVPSNRYTYVIAVIAPFVLFAVSVILITAQILVPAVTFLILLWISVMVGAIADGTKTLLEKNRLRQSFSGSVSPAVLQEILAGNLEGASAKTAEICVLFSDIRGFTGLSEALSPEEVTHLLTRYFDRMVDCVHRYDGTMDKFMGDGMMVFFGAPRSLPNSCGAAVKCAHDMVEQLAKLNEEFAAEGLPHVAIGIGINYGKVVVGNIGSTERHNYSAIGDAVNVASRLEGLTKRLGSPIVMTDSVRDRLGKGFDLIDFGEQPIRGHTAMRMWGVSSVPVTVQAGLPKAASESAEVSTAQ